MQVLEEVVRRHTAENHPTFLYFNSYGSEFDYCLECEMIRLKGEEVWKHKENK